MIIHKVWAKLDHPGPNHNRGVLSILLIMTKILIRIDQVLNLLFELSMTKVNQFLCTKIEKPWQPNGKDRFLSFCMKNWCICVFCVQYGQVLKWWANSMTSSFTFNWRKKSVKLILERCHMCFKYYWPLLNLPSLIIFPLYLSLSAIYDSFKSKVLKMVKSRNGHHFYWVSFS